MIVGLTGGIGSGKSSVAQLFEAMGLPVYRADEASKTLLDSNRPLQRQLMQLLGTDIVAQGKTDRALMAQRIFADKALLQESNALIHPAVAQDFKAWVAHQSAPYLLKEAAILYESGSYRQCARVVVVTASAQTRIKRVMQRSSLSADQVRERMAHQWPEERKMARADYVILNEENIVDWQELHTAFRQMLPQHLTASAHRLYQQIITIHEDIIRRTIPGS